MTYYENLIKHVHAAMEKHPRSPVVMTTDTFRVVASGKNTRKLAVAIKKYGALGRMTAVFQKPSENQTFRVTGIDRFKITGAEEYKGKKCRVDAERGGSR